MKKLLAIFLALLACACAHKTPPPAGVDSPLLNERWQAMETLSNARINSPYRLQLSLRFGTEGDTRRVTAILWGNGPAAQRLDVMAGVGATIAMILEEQSRFLLYTPRDEKAYVHAGQSKPLLKIGIPLPFDLCQLASLLNGNFTGMFGNSFTSAEITSSGQAAYALASSGGGILELAANGLPAAWRQAGAGWNMEIDYPEGSPLPRRLKLTNKKGQMAILLVKERETPADAFPQSQMTLDLPASVPVLPLAKYKPS